MKKTGRSILFAFGTSSLLPILFIGIFLTIHMRKMAYEQSNKEANAEIARVESRIEETLLFMHTVENTIISDTQIKTLVQKDYHSPLEIFNSYSEASLIKRYELTYSDIADIRIYVENKTLLDNLDFMRATADIKSLSWYQKAIALKGCSYGGYYYEDLIMRRDYMLISRSFYIQKNLDGVLMLLIDLKRIKNMMETEPFDLFLLDSDLNVLTCKGDFQLGQKLPGLENIDLIRGNSTWTTEFMGEKAQIIIKNIHQNMLATPLYLVSIIPIEQMVASSREVSLFGGLVVFLSTIGGLALLFGLSNLASNQQEQRNILFQEQMRFEVLASQVNPHFLFNVLESIRMKAHSKGEVEIATIVKKMGALIRRNLEMPHDYITLREELSFVEDYLTIQQFRFGDKIQSSIECNEDLMQLMILPLTIQPIVENAIIHGLEGVKETGNVVIHGKIEAGKLVITVSDSGRGMESDKIMNILQKSKDRNENGEKRIGLMNIQQRLQTRFGTYYGLMFEENHPRGTIVRIIMPIMKSSIREV